MLNLGIMGGIAKLDYFLGVISKHSRAFSKVKIQNWNIFRELLNFKCFWGSI